VLVLLALLSLVLLEQENEKICQSVYEEGHRDGRKESEEEHINGLANEEDYRTVGKVVYTEDCVHTQTYDEGCRNAKSESYGQGFRFRQSVAVHYFTRRQILDAIHRYIDSSNDFDRRT